MASARWKCFSSIAIFAWADIMNMCIADILIIMSIIICITNNSNDINNSNLNMNRLGHVVVGPVATDLRGVVLLYYVIL